MTREKRPFVIFGFASTHEALDAEALLGDLGFDVVPVPSPAALSTRCGIALRVPAEEADRAIRYLDSGGLSPSGRADLEDF